MTDIIEEILILLEKYFVYIYPGFISVSVLCFAKAKKFKKNEIMFITSIVISYIYVVVYKLVRGKEVEAFNNTDYVILFFLAIILPLVWNRISQTEWFEVVLRLMRVNTSVEECVWDYIRYRAKKENEGIAVKVFLDELGIMYEGGLRYHESDSEKEQTICLSGYRRYIKVNGKYEVTNNYENDASRWVMLKANDVKRVEIMYEEIK